MQSVEVSAKTAADATQLAADKLGVSADALKVTVLEETKGLFGKSSVRIRAELIEVAPAPSKKAEKPDGVVAEEPKAAEAKPAPRGSRKKVEPEPAPVATAEPTEPTEATKPRRGKKAAEAPAEVASAKPEEAPVDDEPESEVVATDEDAERLLGILTGLLESANLQVKAEVGSLQGKYVSISLSGRDVAYLVGKHGEVLNALQYLVNIIANRRIGNGVRATLDGNDYRRRREEVLTNLATKIANEVKSRGEEAVLDALPAFERRVVHKALMGIEGVTTYSEGEEPNRRVVIAPAD
jgi:spoIIIJ-associated protein